MSREQLLAAAKASLPAETLAEINAHIDALNISPAQKETMREEALINVSRQIGALKEAFGKINPALLNQQ